jgi:hypothetical protein
MGTFSTFWKLGLKDMCGSSFSIAKTPQRLTLLANLHGSGKNTKSEVQRVRPLAWEAVLSANNLQIKMHVGRTRGRIFRGAE